MKYFGIIDKNDAAIFQLQWKIENISDIILQYFVLCRKYTDMSRYFILSHFSGILENFECPDIKQRKTIFLHV